MRERIEQGILRRVPHAATPTLRLFDGAADGCAGLFIDRYENILLAHFLLKQEDDHAVVSKLPSLLISLALRLRELFGIEVGYLRIHQKRIQESSRSNAKLLWGQDREQFEITEDGIRYFVKPRTALHAGLYVDMREVRHRLRVLGAGKRLLNLFCYTGSLGLAAGVGGAREVCQVDCSSKALAWARENRALNSTRCISTQFRFIADDALAFVAKEVRRVARGAPKWDLIMVDPPVFGRSKGGSFSLLKDLPKLMQGCLTILAPQGSLILTTNYREFSPETVTTMLKALTTSSDFGKVTTTSLLPPGEDFTAQGKASIAMRGVVLKID